MFIIGAMGYDSRIRKNVTGREKRTEQRQRIENRQRTDRKTNYRGHSIPIPMEKRVERANKKHPV